EPPTKPTATSQATRPILATREPPSTTTTPRTRPRSTAMATPTARPASTGTQRSSTTSTRRGGASRPTPTCRATRDRPGADSHEYPLARPTPATPRPDGNCHTYRQIRDGTEPSARLLGGTGKLVEEHAEPVEAIAPGEESASAADLPF